MFTERKVSAKLVGPGTRSGSACPRSPFSLREANGRVSTSFDLVKFRTQYTHRRIHNSLVRCSAFDIKFEIYQSKSVFNRRVAHAKELAELRQEEEKSSSDPDEDPTSRLVVDLSLVILSVTTKEGMLEASSDF